MINVKLKKKVEMNQNIKTMVLSLMSMVMLLVAIMTIAASVEDGKELTIKPQVAEKGILVQESAQHINYKI